MFLLSAACAAHSTTATRLRQLLADVKDGPPEHLSAFERRFGPVPGAAQDGYRWSS
jgi:hypothetical protein